MGVIFLNMKINLKFRTKNGWDQVAQQQEMPGEKERAMSKYLCPLMTLIAHHGEKGEGGSLVHPPACTARRPEGDRAGLPLPGPGAPV